MSRDGAAQGSEEVVLDAENVLRLASYFGVDLTILHEYWLLDIVKHAVLLPLILPWREFEDAAGNPVFVNARTGEKSPRHPLDAAFHQVIHAARSEGPPADNDRRTVMLLRSASGTASYYDFATSSAIDTAPESARLIAAFDRVRLPLYSQDDVSYAKSHNCQEVERYLALAQPAVASLADVGTRHNVCDERPADQQLDAKYEQAQTRRNVERRKKGAKPLKHLTFYSRWFEDAESSDLTGRCNGELAGGGLRARHMTLRMSLETNAFDITIASGGADEPHVALKGLQSVTTTAGMPVQPWDLHVGAVLEALGKYVVLQGCDAATGQWFTALSNNVRTLKQDLLVEFRKYNQEPFSPTMLMMRGEGGGRLSRSYSEHVTMQKQAAVSIQDAADQIMRLAELLEQYRPSIAARFQARLSKLQCGYNRLPSSSSIQLASAMLRSRSASPKGRRGMSPRARRL